ncbi:spore protease YyaC [Paenibacillus naphthalenovorans]|uniref:Sporulation protein n=1 Tax=Paenibacillus naphthalenovorans TaxID=162209 RepID=A0A0U2IM71_9BACL|nr:spore protease YyaC [Paenibacillus naphthalenovorans]ALS22139.1 sporulation protein [Paenibacillus naphthalenovorans]
MKIYMLGKGVYKDYREIVKGNKNITVELAQRKLTRNVHLSHRVKISKDIELCFYGKLHIYIKNDKKIIKIFNAGYTYPWFKRDKEKYNQLNEVLGLMKKKSETTNKLATNAQELTEAMKDLIPKNITTNDVHFICIGTDRSTGDSLSPMIGTELSRLGYKVDGNLETPVHAMNINEYVEKLPKDKTIIAIGSVLGKLENVEKIQFSKGGHRTGAGVGREGLPIVGDYSIGGIVNVSGYMEYFVLQNTRLAVVNKLSKIIVEAIKNRFPIQNEVAI